jgi:hypothetical protein
MIRYFLGVGDRAGSAVITEGLPSVSCSNPPPRVQISTLYMKTYCTACKREGFIAPKGPRRPGTASNGEQWALSGDINMCGCTPPPVFHAERGMWTSFTSQEAAALVGNDVSASARQTETARYDEQFTLTDHAGQRLAGVRYRVRVGSNVIASGVTDAGGRTQRVNTEDTRRLTLEISGGT